MSVSEIKHILFPVDLSARSQETAPSVKTMARRFNAQVTLMSVMRPSGEDFGELAPDPKAAKDGLQARLNDTYEKEFAPLSIQRIAELGDTVDVVIRFVDTHGVDLVMMPTYGRGPFRTLQLGSVVAGVLHYAQCRVWTATHAEEPFEGTHLPCRVVACAVDRTPKSNPVIEWAAWYSKNWNATLHLVHVISEGEGEECSKRPPDRGLHEVLQREASETIKKLQRSVGVRAPLTIATGEVPEGVRESAIRLEADSLVIGRSLFDGLHGRLGRHSHGIIRRAPCPVVSV